MVIKTTSENKTGAAALHKTRVIGIYAHIDAGKTTTSEAILYYTGRIHRLGSVDAGNTQLDWMEQERSRGITITAAATTCQWKGCRINLIDTPGHIDFTAEVVRSIRVIDGAVIVLCGVGGVETQTETVWRHADRQGLPRLVFVNKLDREVADFGKVVEDVRKRLSAQAVPVQWPLGSGESLRGIIDLLERKAWVFPEGSEEPAQAPVPAEMAGQIETLRDALVDAICETDERLLGLRLEGQVPEPQALIEALRSATIQGKLVPVLCGSARLRIGIHKLLDAIAAYLPSPLDRPAVTGSLPGKDLEEQRPAELQVPFCASVFKIVTDQHVGHLAWARVFSGRLLVGDPVYNPRAELTERVGRIYQIHANRREHADQAQVGDVVALVGPKSAVTGDTLCDPASPINLEPFRFPEPVISVALSPVADEERDRLHQSITRLCQEDPTLLLSFDAETGEQVLSGMGELHLEISVDRLRSEYGLVVRSSPLQVAYRETILHKAEATGAYRKQTGGHGHFALARLRVEPVERGTGIVFRSIASPLEVPDGYVRAVEAGAREALAKGSIAGYPLTDLRLTLVGGRYHEIDSDSMDFRIAGSMAARQAIRQADPVLLEPVMQADITVGEEYLGAVIADFGRRRGTVGEFQVRDRLRNFTGEVPLAEVRGYATELRSMTQGRGAFTLEFRRYEITLQKIAEQIIEQRTIEGKIARR